MDVNADKRQTVAVERMKVARSSFKHKTAESQRNAYNYKKKKKKN